MTHARAETLEAPRPIASTLAVAQVGLWVLLAGHLIATWGTQWDIQWHLTIGRDSFWIPPHVMTYSGVTVLVLVSFGMLAWMSARGVPETATVRVLGLTGTPGYHLAAWGIALTVAAAPIDDLWHRLFGLDVTLWSPPHLLGLLGAVVNAAACAVIARETLGHRLIGHVASLFAAALVYGSLALAAQPGVRMAYVHGGVAFFTYPILAALLAPLPLVAAARATGLRAAPALIVATVFALGIIGAEIARVGFAWLQPTSFLAEEIAKDPTSPIAVMHEIARKNGTAPRAGNVAVLLCTLLASAAMVAVDPRRRPRLATLAFGLTLFLTVTLWLARLPAYAQSLPSALDVVAGAVFTSLAALAAGTLAS